MTRARVRVGDDEENVRTLLVRDRGAAGRF